jgi:DHA1 family tetracycline resistance protein-like MFS transporter
MTNLFAFFTGPSAPIQFAGAPFLLGAILMLGSTLLSYITLRHERYLAGSGIAASALELKKEESV